MNKYISAVVRLNNLSYLAGETLVISVLAIPEQLNEVEVDFIKNVSVDIDNIEIERNQFAFGEGGLPDFNDGIYEISINIPDTIKAGLYCIGSIVLTNGDIDAPKNIYIHFDSPCFVVQAHAEILINSLTQLQERIERIKVQRSIYSFSALTTEDASKGGATDYRVFIFGLGCLIHTTQQLKGYKIQPLGQGFSHVRMHEIVNLFLSGEQLTPLNLQSQTEIQFAQSTPTFVVNYNRVSAISYEDAAEYCRRHSSKIFEILGLDRGQKPSEFALLIEEYQSGNRRHSYKMPWYKGNLVADFNPASTANRIDSYFPALDKNPFLQLLVRTFTDASAEDNDGFALLRYWSVMELVAKRDISEGIEIHNPDGTAILNAAGKKIETKNTAARVYKYILDSNSYSTHGMYTVNGVQQEYIIGDASHSGFKPSTRIFSLWDIVKAIYSIRNSIAHSGVFDAANPFTDNEKFAVELMNLGANLHPLNLIKHHAQFAIWQEIRKT